MITDQIGHTMSDHDERPLRVWLYRGWCWVCNQCKSSDWGYRNQQSALSAALHHCDLAEWRAAR
jgi:hypothetical protein